MAQSITTRSYDTARTGATDHETVLTATAVRTKGIVKLFSMSIPDDPRLDAQPLAVSGIKVADGHLHDVIFQASMGNTVYAFDATTGTQLWKTNLGTPIISTKKIDMHGTNTRWGILSTPVVDEAKGILYACTWISPDGSSDKGQHFLAALRLSDGALVHPLLSLEGATYSPDRLPQQKFASAERKQRAALVLTQGHVLIPFGSVSEDSPTARGWLIAVDAAAWGIAATWCSTVTGHGGGIWHSGAGPALAADGSIFVITGNGAFAPEKGDYSESIVKLKLKTGAQPGFTVNSWWTPWTDRARNQGNQGGSGKPRSSNVQMIRVLGHAHRLGLANVPAMDPGNVSTGAHPDDAKILAVVQDLILSNGTRPDWSDQDFGSGGPVYVEAANVVLACGKDGILYTMNAPALGNTKPANLGAGATAANYAKLRFPPILYTFFDPSVPPAPDDAEALNRVPGSASRHLHGTSLLWKSKLHGLMHFVGGENSALRAWTIDANGASTYLAGSDEIASPQAARPPGGMPGWSTCLAGNNGEDGIIVAMVPYTDSNMTSSPGRMLVYDAQNFAVNADGSKRLQLLWDTQNWGPDHAFTHPKFNRPVVWNGRIYRPTYDGRIDVYGLAT